MATRVIDITRSPTLPRRVDKHWKTRSNINKIILHCTDRDWTIDELYEYDVLGEVNGEINRIDSNGLPGITYVEVFMKDGLQYHCNDWKDWIWHAAGHNQHTLGAAIMYKATADHYSLPNREPPDAAVDAFISWAARSCLYLGLDPYKAVQGHRELKGTGWFFDKKGHKQLRKVCPGLRIDMNNIRLRVAIYAQKFLYLKAKNYNGLLDLRQTITEFADGIWGPKTRTLAKALYKRRELLLEAKHGGLLT